MTTHTPAPAHLTDAEIQDIADGFDIYGAKPEFARAIESALLSKLRAPVADSTLSLEMALHELVSKIAPGLDAGDLLKDAQRASAMLDAIITSTAVTDERAAFEAWAVKYFTHPFMRPAPLIPDPDGSGDYADHDVQIAWSGFQQACAALASAPVAGERQLDGKRPDLDWIEDVCVTDTVGRGWCVRIDGTDIFEEVNRYGCKGRKSFQIASGLPSKQEAERAALEWLDRQRAALASAPVADNWQQYALPGETTAEQVCERMNAEVTRRTVAAMRASAPVAGEAQPSDVDILGLAGQYIHPRSQDAAPQIVNFARALLARYVTPQASEAVQRAGYAGVTVWVGDRQATQIVTQQGLELSNKDELLERFEVARAALSAQPGAQKDQ